MLKLSGQPQAAGALGPANPLEPAASRRPLSPEWALPAAVALAACLLCWAAGWRGTDWAAQIYRAGQVSRHGLALWDPGWYGGTYPLSYSLIFPLAGGYLGLWPVAAASAGGAAACFDRLLPAELRRPPIASYYFALTTFIEVAIGQLPTLAGEALALGCLLALRSRRPGVLAGGLGLGALAGLTSPVAGSFLALALAAWGLSAKGLRQVVPRLAAAAFVLALSAALPLAFHEPGWFPFSFSEAGALLLIAAFAASPIFGLPPALRAGAVLYALVTAFLYFVRTPMGDNDARLGAYIAVPILLGYLPQACRRVAKALGARWPALLLAGGAALCLLAWDWSPVLEAFGGATDGASSVASYYQPLEAELARLSGGEVVRVEVPPLAHHWESAYLAPHFPLARGWERQLDIAYAPLFYRRGPLGPSAYYKWLVANGVSYVALAKAPLDYAGVAEAALLRSGRAKGLVAVWHSKHWELWKVMGATGLADGPAKVAGLSTSGVLLRFSRPGTSVVRVRWGPYWSLAPRSAMTTCLKRAPGGWTEVSSKTAGYITLRLQLVGADHGRSCTLPSRAATP